MEQEIVWSKESRVIDLALNLTRGQITGVKVNGQGITKVDSQDDTRIDGQDMTWKAGVTRLRLESKQSLTGTRLKLNFQFKGESPIPESIRIFEDAPSNFEKADAEGVSNYLECRRRYASVPGPIGLARKFFLALDRRTNSSISKKNTEVFETMKDFLKFKIEERFNPGNRFNVSVPPEAVDFITELFQEASLEVYQGRKFEEELDAYLLFAAGQLEHACPFLPVAAGPNGGSLFYFAEFGFWARDLSKQDWVKQYWSSRIPTLVLMQEIFGQRFSCPKILSDLEPGNMSPVSVIDYETIQLCKKNFISKIEKDPEKYSYDFLQKAIASF